MFESLKEDNRPNGLQYVTSLMISLVAHTAVLGLLVVLPLMFFNVLHADELITFLIMPPSVPVPPVPPVAPITHRPSAESKIFIGNIDQRPITIPNGIHPEIEPPDTLGIDTVVQGINPLSQGKVTESPIDRIVKLNQPTILDPPPPPIRHAPIQVSGLIQDAKLIRRVYPVYPRLAIQAHVSGIVRLEATIDEEGTITDLKILEGHPLLRQAAYDAVKQWQYRPTMIGGEPVPVSAIVIVIFRLK